MSAIVAIRFVQAATHNQLPAAGHCKLQFNRRAGLVERFLPQLDG
jgi:hypothetical protein